MTRIELGGYEATIEDYRWSCENATLERLLNSYIDPGGPSGADPNPDHTAARFVVDRLGGRIVEYDAVESREGAIY